MNERVLVTGANGFVGGHLCDHLAARGFRVRIAVRREMRMASASEVVVVGDLGRRTDWSAAVRDVDFVIHAAARVHDLADRVSYEEANEGGTESLAAAAVAARLSRLVLLSTIKVNGNESGHRGFSPDDPPRPEGDYAISKLGAERALARLCAGSGTSYAIVRPPLVYGPGVGANFLSLMHWVDRAYPLPFGAIHNRRSMISVWNLADLLVRLLHHPQGGRTWMVSDDEDHSTPDLIRMLSGAMCRRARLFAVPEALLRLAGRAAGREADVRRLCGSLFVDVSHTRASLGWKPVVDVAGGLARTAAWYAELR